MRSVCPSGADFATKSAPIWPLAPGRKGTTMRTGFDGKPCADAPAEEKTSAAATNASSTRRRIGISPGARPQHALAPARNRAHALVDEFLHAFAFVGLGGVEVALRVARDAVHAIELAGLAPAVAEVRNLLQRVAQYDAHLPVLAIG